VHRFRRLAFGAAAAILVAHVAASGSGALVCADHGGDEAAAMEAVGGDHPQWADGYVIGRVDAIDDLPHTGVRLTLTPTHAFGGAPREPIRLATRVDGPPDPSMWAVGAMYFLSVSGPEGVEGADGIVSPCAPNFRISDAGQLDRLVAAADSVTVLEDDVVVASAVPMPILGAFIGAVAIGLVSWRAFRGRLPGSS
jgi:hypothetical protein